MPIRGVLFSYNVPLVMAREKYYGEYWRLKPGHLEHYITEIDEKMG